MTARMACRAFLAMGLLQGSFGLGLAQEASLVPPSASPFGPPTVGVPGKAPPITNKPTLPSPADIPDSALATSNDPNVDLAFGAYQRGFYSTALREATKRLASNDKDGPAMTLLGELYSQGLGVKPDKREAARWFTLGAATGAVQSMLELGIMRMKGDGIPKDEAGAKAMFEQAAAQDDPAALFYLGLIALQNNGIVQDAKGASSYFERAAALGNADAEYALGLMYRQGNGVPKDEAKAAPLIKAAADEDNLAAMIEYGIMLFNGIGVDKDEAEAARLFIKAAGHNNPVAQNRAARLLVAGRGVKKDIVEGLKWHVLANSTGLKDAWLDSQMRLLTPEQRSAVDIAVRRYIGS